MLEGCCSSGVEHCVVVSLIEKFSEVSTDNYEATCVGCYCCVPVEVEVPHHVEPMVILENIVSELSQ